ncbi:unnamed protein product [Sympodiomycopsis kandeliae]
MILLEDENALLLSTLSAKFTTPGPIDQAFTDFDGVAYYLESSKTGPVNLSMDIRCWKELQAAGAMDILKREYGDYLQSSPLDGYSVSLSVPYESVPQDPAARNALVQSLSLLKRNTMAAPFERAFAFQKQLEPTLEDPSTPVPQGSTDIMTISYRDDEAIYIVPGADRVTVVFSTTFKEETDKIFGRVFLQEFVDARRQPSIQNAPQVLYSNREPPLEIRSIANLSRGEDVGYVTFVLFPRHFNTPHVASQTISRVILFRDYLHYHIKASKAYMHSRMRARVTEFLKVLNRAKPETQERDRKTATGRTFRRQV